MENDKQLDLSEVIEKTFSVAGSATENMLKTATRYAVQLEPDQIRCLTLIRFCARISAKNRDFLNGFYDDYIEMKKYDRSALFVSQLLRDMSLSEYVGKGLDIKVDK